jgi:hypothetical protein
MDLPRRRPSVRALATISALTQGPRSISARGRSTMILEWCFFGLRPLVPTSCPREVNLERWVDSASVGTPGSRGSIAAHQPRVPPALRIGAAGRSATRASTVCTILDRMHSTDSIRRVATRTRLACVRCVTVGRAWRGADARRGERLAARGDAKSLYPLPPAPCGAPYGIL